MAESKLVGLLFEAWKDTDRALAGLDAAEAVLSRDGGSSYAWTASHVANQVDAWLNTRFQRLDPHELGRTIPCRVFLLLVPLCHRCSPASSRR